jgi:hypothetical protein
MSGWNLAELVKGKTPTFLTTNYGNKVIKALNALGNIEIYADTSDRVVYTDDTIYIYYKKLGYEISGEFELIDSSDITKMYKVTVDEGTITAIDYVDSKYSIKELEVCEDGVTQTYKFVIET